MQVQKTVSQAIGACIGASTLSVVGIGSASNGELATHFVYALPHHGNPRAAFLEILKKVSPHDGVRIAVTGRNLRESLELTTITEPLAIETALSQYNGIPKDIDAVVSAGGENFLVYILGKDGKIWAVRTGNKCASGTGEFFLQQIRRIGLSLEEAMYFAKNEAPYKVSGRCSVFCKSDCTHATNKGVPKGRIVAGLCEMIAGKIVEILRQIPRHEKILLIGGLTQNQVVLDFLRTKVKCLIIPKEAHYFEAYGAAIWALQNETVPLVPGKKIFKGEKTSFSFLPPLKESEHLVEFKSMEWGSALPGDRLIIGLDVGSTTTKAVLMRLEDHAILGSIYLRTEGNPVYASRACFISLYEQLGELAGKVKIIGIGVTGSGRQIAGLYTLTDGIINEIIAHATGALFFDNEVETIFEIGGQDAKYTYLVNGVAADYAMNDACSAGTGSFLEEVAKETMGVKTEDIGEMALLGNRPPNFNDQCAAFISSDVKTAFQEGLTKEDILAGLVYSICMNYNNRVKGNRPVGKKVFMQGGVCYNRAVPIAMAYLTGKKIVVPPEPGLMGAFGVALELEKRIKAQLLPEKSYSLKELIERKVEERGTFTCRGERSGCDRKCEIMIFRIDGKNYPFGGSCNRWYNVRKQIKVDADKYDLIRFFEKHFFPQQQKSGRESIGINKSFFTNLFYPLFSRFFEELGLTVVLPDTVEGEGVELKGAAFCYPAEIAHGYMYNLLKKSPDYLFLPHIKMIKGSKDNEKGVVCPFAQGEPYFLSSAFKDHDLFNRLKKEGKILKPLLDFSDSSSVSVKESFVQMGKALGKSEKAAIAAYHLSRKYQEEKVASMKDSCEKLLKELEKDKSQYAIVILGRVYNAFVSETNMGIPQKIATRGVPVIPYLFLPIDDYEVSPEMYWATGQMILKASKYVANHDQLYACYITNFSCGPDSFILEYFRHEMGKKPYLILEIDSHVADAGLETRIEAFIDIIHNYRELQKKKISPVKGSSTFTPARFDHDRALFIDSQGRTWNIRNERIKVLIPSMGAFSNQAAAAAFRSLGIQATALPPADEEVLKIGRSHTSCKECLPLLLTLGSILKYVKEQKSPEECLLYFMPTASGPCRFGQYSYFIRHMIRSLEIPNVALFSLQAENSYEDLGGKDLTLRLWAAIVLADIFQDLYAAYLTNAADWEKAKELFFLSWREIIKTLESTPDLPSITRTLGKVAQVLSTIAIVRPWQEIPTILLSGEIFVRHDDLSRRFLIDLLAKKGFIAKTAGLSEWVYYTDYCFSKNLASLKPTLKERISLSLRYLWMRNYERKFKKIMAQCGAIPFPLERVGHLVEEVRDIISPYLTGEAILTIGGAITEVPYRYQGVIAIGPFGCMPNRLAEAILSREMGQGWQERAFVRRVLLPKLIEKVYELPFLAIESDGNPFPQMINAKLEVFLAQVERLHKIKRNVESVK